MTETLTRPLTVAERVERDAGERFLHDVGAWKNETTGSETKAHEMTVLRDDGLYRHVKFAKPSSGFYWFELLTWPGHLTINGDMGCFTFSRVSDMFTFFRGDRINTTYWAEKVQGHRGGIEEYSEEIFRQLVLEAISDHEEEFPGLADAVKEQILDELDGFEDNARELVRDFEFGAKPHFSFVDAWEWDLKDYSIGFLWCCYAIQWGIAMYDAARLAAVPAVTAGGSDQEAEKEN